MHKQLINRYGNGKSLSIVLLYDLFIPRNKTPNFISQIVRETLYK